MPIEIRQFLSYKETMQNRSPLTVAEYANDLRTFFRYMKAKRNNLRAEDIDGLSIDDIDKAFIVSVTEADIDTPQFRTGEPKYLSLDESIELIDSVQKTDYAYARNHAILTLFLNCGIRLSELVGISLSDISPDMKKMTVTGKGSKMRTIYLNTACRNALKAYLEVRQSSVHVRITDPNALFLSSRGNRISNKTVQWMVKKQLAQIGLGKGYSTHKLRHTAATLMYSEGNVDVRALKDILGHEQLNTTQIYTHVSDKKLEAAMEANPLAKKK